MEKIERRSLGVRGWDKTFFSKRTRFYETGTRIKEQEHEICLHFPIIMVIMLPFQFLNLCSSSVLDLIGKEPLNF